MKKSSEYINEKVFKVNQKYARLQNKTEELFFRCLDEERSVEYFIKKLDEIWGNIDHSYIQEDIDNYIDMIQEYNLYMLGVPEKQKKNYKALKIATLTGVALMLYEKQQKENQKEEKETIKLEEKYEDFIVRKYKQYSKTKEYKENKEEYLRLKVPQFNSQIVPYFSKSGELIRYVNLSTYLSMIHNTNLTRSAWNNTITDGLYLGYERFWIPPHLFSCEHCVEWQGKILNINEVLDFVSNAEEQEGDILHPNCKCSLLLYTPNTTLRKQEFSLYETEEYYNIRQKVNSLTLKKERILTEMRIYERMGFQSDVDRLNNQRKKVNTQIRELTDELPTEEMKKKVVAINR